MPNVVKEVINYSGFRILEDSWILEWNIGLIDV
jgi:hypothetical protein